jgi:hypothetical protein
MRGEPGTGRRRIHVLCIAVTVLAVYLSALSAGFLALDDTDTIRFIQSGKVAVFDLIFSGGRGYYRPLSTLSLLMDFHFFGGNPAGYHLANILLHLANALLVYHLATLLMRGRTGNSFFPFMAGMLFAVHPVNSEAVVWICARPDLLSCFFFLLAFIALIRAGRRCTFAAGAFIFVAFLFSLMSKEASLFLIALAPLWLYLERDTVTWRGTLAACVPLFFAALVYFVLRQGLPVVSDPAVASTPASGGLRLSSIVEGAAAYGFYLRKLVYPFPLNIAITEISTGLYAGVFLVGIAVSIPVWLKNTALRAPLCFLVLSLIPPIGAMYLSLPWTPYAERYLYLPSVAFSLCAVFLWAEYAERIPRPFPVACVLLFALLTAHRVALWTRPIPFWLDAVDKSPRFGTIRLLLSASYLQEGRYREAEVSLREALRLGLPRKNARDFSVTLERMLKEKSGGKPGVLPRIGSVPGKGS